MPAYFDDTRRKATMDAGRIAGLDVLDIIDEPSAAALAYSVTAVSPAMARSPAAAQTVLVYDLGGGTFDVTLVKLGKKRFQVLAIEGDVRLGGKDWDDRLANWAAEKFRIQLRLRPARRSAIARRCSTPRPNAPRRRSRRSSKRVSPSSHDGHRLTMPVSRTEFETLTKDLARPHAADNAAGSSRCRPDLGTG